MSSKGKKYDTNKRRWMLLPIRPIEKIIDVLMYGANKYGDNNWKKSPNLEDRYFAALLRHLMAWRKGEHRDPESGMLHLSHAACNAIFLLWHELKKEKK